MKKAPPKTTPAADFKAFQAAHPETRYVDAILTDLCGIVRGKRYPMADAEKLFTGGLQLCESVFLLDVTGANTDPAGRGFTDGDPDGTLVPVPGTLVPVPWAEEPRGQVLMTMTTPEGAPSPVDPRNVANGVLKRFDELGLTPVVAFELEFYLLDQERDAAGLPQPPISPATGRREASLQVYGIQEIDGFAAFLRDVEAAGEVQKVPANIATAEFAPGQYEINLHHVDDAMAAADHAALLRHIIKSVAQRHGIEASFMPKPFLEQTGNGMHVHVSLLDKQGRNVFAAESPLGSETLQHAIGGLMATMAEAMAIFAPNVNAFRRFGPNLFVPVNRSWGANNRSVAFRIPTGPPDSRRIEHRFAGADANSYLVLAAILAGIHHGIANKIDPGPASEGNACETVDPDLPLDVPTSLDRIETAKILGSYLGPEYLQLYAATKRNEYRDFMNEISQREYAWYL